jgi:hypothetical protein
MNYTKDRTSNFPPVKFPELFNAAQIEELNKQNGEKDLQTQGLRHPLPIVRRYSFRQGLQALFLRNYPGGFPFQQAPFNQPDETVADFNTRNGAVIITTTSGIEIGGFHLIK